MVAKVISTGQKSIIEQLTLRGLTLDMLEEYPNNIAKL